METNAGGSRVGTEFVGLISNLFRQAGEARSRPHGSTIVTYSVDNIMHPPEWYEDKDVTISGRKLTRKDRDGEHWENKYAKELAIGEVLVREHRRDGVGIGGVKYHLNRMKERLGILPPTDEEIKESVSKRLVVEENLKQNYEKRLRGETENITWDALLKIWQSEDSIVEATKKYRKTFDVWSIDEFLDSSLTLGWLCFKVGTCIGIVHGGVRAMRAMHVDGHFMQATGLGMIAFLNTSIFASVLKYAGNFTVASAGFSVGDRAVSHFSTSMWPLAEGERYHRSPANYTVGMGCAFASVGIVPYWVLNDIPLAMRMSALGFGIGALTGYAIGHGMQRMVALNFQRLDVSEEQLRAYMLTTYYLRDSIDEEFKKMKYAREHGLDSHPFAF